jgi:hypothetical protein
MKRCCRLGSRNAYHVSEEIERKRKITSSSKPCKKQCFSRAVEIADMGSMASIQTHRCHLPDLKPTFMRYPEAMTSYMILIAFRAIYIISTSPTCRKISFYMEYAGYHPFLGEFPVLFFRSKCTCTRKGKFRFDKLQYYAARNGTFNSLNKNWPLKTLRIYIKHNQCTIYLDFFNILILKTS